jgi:hypothetical protein
MTSPESDRSEPSASQPEPPDASNHASRSEVGGESRDTAAEQPRATESAEDPSNRVARTDVTDAQRAQEYRDMARDASDAASMYRAAQADARREQALIGAMPQPGGTVNPLAAASKNSEIPPSGRR